MRTAVVRAPVATLFTQPDAVRQVDRPALGPAPDLAAWVAGLSREQRMGAGVVSQLLLGEQVLVEHITGGWARVVAVEQPAARLDPRGYPGWLPVDQLTEEPAVTVDRLVTAVTTALRDRPAGELLVAGVVLGSRLAAAGPPVDGWLPVRVPGAATPRWVPVADLAPLPDAASVAAGEALRVAELFAGAPYVWGGRSPHGVDCSGLVGLAWRRLGVTLPRNAADQADATQPVPLGEELPGDLYVFARPGVPIHHIGLVAAEGEGGRRHILHASSTARRVLCEPLPPNRAETLAGARRVKRATWRRSKPASKL